MGDAMQCAGRDLDLPCSFGPWTRPGPCVATGTSIGPMPALTRQQMACRAGQCNEDLSGKQLTSVGTLESRKSEIEGIERKCGHPALALQGVQLQDLSFRTINGSGERPSFAKLCKGRYGANEVEFK
ncbi:hypothetical protein CRG98_028778 [Punica granatum]|uniref:Uncharacterized protein n=1 Tax=Punica granatum TaxID=22663 RepID=A0A2I0J409_PUNGR|nr:hypothetical protein CRG98_028778 [Punica granatum]